MAKSGRDNTIVWKHCIDCSVRLTDANRTDYWQRRCDPCVERVQEYRKSKGETWGSKRASVKGA